MTIPTGIGDADFDMAIYIANRPPLDEYQKLQGMRPLIEGEIQHIGQQTSNHWRKIFNVYSKLIFQMNSHGFKSWQEYRDNHLLQAGSKTALLFSPLDLTHRNDAIRLVAGKTHAANLGLDLDSMEKPQADFSNDFAWDKVGRVIVTPYLDYRQLSNIKIDYLVNKLIKSMR
jgi:Family of unknown function (DUF6942)